MVGASKKNQRLHRALKLFSGLVSRNNTVSLCTAIAIGTPTAFLLHALFVLVQPSWEILKTYIAQQPRAYVIAMALLLFFSLLTVTAITTLPRLWRSLRMGLLRFPLWLGSACVTGWWLLIGFHHLRIALAEIISVCALLVAMAFLRQRSLAESDTRVSTLESDLPVPEKGEDLLGRGDIVNSLVAAILYERPLVIAVTAPYGQGKTSFLNLLVGEIKKVEPTDLPIIVRFSPWLAADSNALVLSLLNSIVSEMDKRYVLPGLKREAVEYAQMLLSIIPKVDRLKSLFSEPSQEDRIRSLAQRISETKRRVLVILDDLDRMDAKELETIFKLLRGSETLLSFTFLCAFDREELVRILKVSRPFQDADTFIDKFFQLPVPLPKIDSLQLREVFLQKISAAIEQYSHAPAKLSKSLSEVWANGGEKYLNSLRRIKLFLNKTRNSLARIGTEVNPCDFVRLELVRDIAPAIYDEIYANPSYFYDSDLAFEVAFTGRIELDDSRAKKRRAAFYDRLIGSLSTEDEKESVSELLVDLFPHFADYKGKVGRGSVNAYRAEENKHIFHPRFFRQYFLLKVPSELVSQKEFDNFLSSVHGSEQHALVAFGRTFKSLEKEDFKRWHLLHRIENVFSTFDLQTARGLCRGFAQNSSIWPSDAFELMTAIRCTRATLFKMKEESDRENFLRVLLNESSSMLYGLMLEEALEKEDDGVKPPLSDFQPTKDLLKKNMRQHYLVPDAPSVIAEFSTDLGKIEPIRVLFAWRRLGPDAELEQRKYLTDLLGRRPSDLDWFLGVMFRGFMDDYSALKPLIDYDELAQLIEANRDALTLSKVEQFRTRRRAERNQSTETSNVA